VAVTDGVSGNLMFPPQEKVIFGQGSVSQLADELDRLGKKRAFVITGTTVAKKTDLLSRVQEVLGRRLAGIYFPYPSMFQGMMSSVRLPRDGK